jgi:hypothetical protein
LIAGTRRRRVLLRDKNLPGFITGFIKCFPDLLNVKDKGRAAGAPLRNKQQQNIEQRPSSPVGAKYL